MEEIKHALNRSFRRLDDIKKVLRIIALILFVNFSLTFMDAVKDFIHESASFDKYIEMEQDASYISEATIYNNTLTYTHTFDRIVKLKDSYSTLVLMEFVCDQWGNKKNVKGERLLDEEGNPWIVTDDVKIRDIYIEPWDSCVINYHFIINPNWYEKDKTLQSNVFIVE